MTTQLLRTLKTAARWRAAHGQKGLDKTKVDKTKEERAMRYISVICGVIAALAFGSIFYF